MTDKLESAVLAWFRSPINDEGTPYVPCPEDFTPEEQDAFISLVREPRRVSREEQHEKIRSIRAARPPGPEIVALSEAELACFLLDSNWGED